jgi:hypothetical protein
MKRNFLIVLSLCVGLLALSIPVIAHHAISAEFDTTKPIKFEGTVKTVDWMNPHIYVNIETLENGKPVLYSVEEGGIQSNRPGADHYARRAHLRTRWRIQPKPIATPSSIADNGPRRSWPVVFLAYSRIYFSQSGVLRE